MIWLRSKAGQILAAIVAGAAFIAALTSKAKRDARKEIAHDQLQDSIERQERGAQAVRDGRASGKPNDDRVRDNDDRWS